MLNNTKSLRKEFARFVIPSVVAQWVFALYSMVDGMFVARGVGEVAVSAVNLSMPVLNLIFALSLALAVGSSTIIAIQLGRGNSKEASQVYSQNLIVSLGISLAFGALILLNLERVALFLGAGEGTLEFVKQYVGTVAAFCPCFTLAYYFEILIKTDGRPKLATVLVFAGTVLNCILDYVFVFIIPWGIFGAAFATGVAQTLVTLFFLLYFCSKRAKLRFTRFRFAPRLVGRTLRLGISSGITELSSGLMIFLFNHAILAFIGQDALVSYTIVAYINTIVVMSMTGIAQGFQPLVSYYYGKGAPQRCKRLLRYGLFTAAGLGLVAVFVGTLGAGGIVGIFVSEQNRALRQYSVEVMRIFSVSFLLVGFNVVIGGYLTAVEYAKSAMVVSLGRGFAFLAFALWLLTWWFGGTGIWWAPAFSEGICGVLAFVLLLHNRRQATLHPAASES